MRTISLWEFRNTIAEVLRTVETGEMYCITRNGVEVAELRPLTVARRPEDSPESHGV